MEHLRKISHEQASKWAINIAKSRNKKAVLNRYKLNRAAILENARCKVFEHYDVEWLKFIIANRSGENAAVSYDYVEGGVANDRVIDTVNLYLAGLIELKSALKELSKHQPNNQMCILSQDIVNKYLIFDGTEEL